MCLGATAWGFLLNSVKYFFLRLSPHPHPPWRPTQRLPSFLFPAGRPSGRASLCTTLSVPIATSKVSEVITVHLSYLSPWDTSPVPATRHQRSCVLLWLPILVRHTTSTVCVLSIYRDGCCPFQDVNWFGCWFRGWGASQWLLTDTGPGTACMALAVGLCRRRALLLQVCMSPLWCLLPCRTSKGFGQGAVNQYALL